VLFRNKNISSLPAISVLNLITKANTSKTDDVPPFRLPYSIYFYFPPVDCSSLKIVAMRLKIPSRSWVMGLHYIIGAVKLSIAE
jgi:hypothetical protein